MPLKYKLTEDGKSIQMDDKGLPILIDDDDNSEIAIDAIGLYTKVPTLNQEAKERRLENKDLKKKLATFDGIEDPAKAIAAMETVQNLEDGDLVKAKDMEALKEKLSKDHKDELERVQTAAKDKETAYEATISDLDGSLRKLVISNAFKGSERVRGIEHIPLDFIESRFGKNFKAEKVGEGDNAETIPVGYLDGKPIYSKADPTKYAGFDEAFETMINAHPEKDKFAVGKGGGPKLPGQKQVYNQPTELPGGAEKIKAGLQQRGYN